MTVRPTLIQSYIKQNPLIITKPTEIPNFWLSNSSKSYFIVEFLVLMYFEQIVYLEN